MPQTSARTTQIASTAYALKNASLGTTKLHSAVLMNLNAAPISTSPPTTFTAFIQSPLRGRPVISDGTSASTTNGSDSTAEKVIRPTIG